MFCSFTCSSVHDTALRTLAPQYFPFVQDYQLTEHKVGRG